MIASITVTHVITLRVYLSLLVFYTGRMWADSLWSLDLRGKSISRQHVMWRLSILDSKDRTEVRSGSSSYGSLSFRLELSYSTFLFITVEISITLSLNLYFNCHAALYLAFRCRLLHTCQTLSSLDSYNDSSYLNGIPFSIQPLSANQVYQLEYKNRTACFSAARSAEVLNLERYNTIMHWKIYYSTPLT